MAAVITEQFLSLRSPRIAVTFNPVLPLSLPTPGPKDSSIQDCIHVSLGAPVSEFTSWQCGVLLDPGAFHSRVVHLVYASDPYRASTDTVWLP